MKTLKIIPLFCLLFFNCSSQDKQNSKENSFKPDENIQVNKEYDEYGNLIRYDSIYSYSYSSNDSISNRMKMQFQKHFDSHPFFNDDFFDDFFDQDSIDGSFNSRDFFHDGFINQDNQIKNMMRRMDSIQQLFFNHHTQDKFKEPTTPKTKNMKLSHI